MTLARLLLERELLVCVGPGGVGKTTVAAAMALSAARRGRRVLVLTIDPARRLADALGVRGVGNAAQTVWPSAGARKADAGRLDAAMLDTQESYDALIRRLQPDPASAERILENSVYRAFSRTLARSHAYAAMERLHEAIATGDYDLIVLDTPPTRSALDILDAPGRLARFLDDGIVRWFVRPVPTGTLSRLLSRGGGAALRLLALLVSRRLVGELSEFFRLLLDSREGFQERAEAIGGRLRSASTAFVLVAAPDRTCLSDAEYLRAGLLERGVPLAAVVLNRAFIGADDAARSIDGQPLGPNVQRRLLAGIDSPRAESFARALAELDALAHRVAQQNREAAVSAGELVRALPPGCSVRRLPDLGRDVADVPGLERLARLLSD